MSNDNNRNIGGGGGGINIAKVDIKTHFMLEDRLFAPVKTLHQHFYLPKDKNEKYLHACIRPNHFWRMRILVPDICIWHCLIYIWAYPESNNTLFCCLLKLLAAIVVKAKTKLYLKNYPSSNKQIQKKRPEWSNTTNCNAKISSYQFELPYFWMPA